jgi:ribosomal protein S27AE
MKEGQQIGRTEPREVLSGMKDWRAQNPRATGASIEEELDERVNEMRARMLEDAVHWSEAVDLAARQGGKRIHCNKCGGVLQDRGKHKRKLVTQGNKQIELERSYGYCPTCRVGFFPAFHEELELLPKESYTQSGAGGDGATGDVDALSRLPRRELEFFTKVNVVEATIRVETEKVGAVQVALKAGASGNH